jgi:hypothetical protein
VLAVNAGDAFSARHVRALATWVGLPYDPPYELELDGASAVERADWSAHRDPPDDWERVQEWDSGAADYGGGAPES